MNIKDKFDLLKITGAFHEDLEAVFFEAMTAGYSISPTKGTIPELPGSKLIPPYIREPWKVIDTYVVTPASSYSGGMTIIYYDGIPVWMMQYFGEYDKAAIPCLKAALREAYERKEFIGGRGPQTFTQGEYTYWNQCDLGNFESFHGREGVNVDYPAGFYGSGTIGYHSYQGGLML